MNSSDQYRKSVLERFTGGVSMIGKCQELSLETVCFAFQQIQRGRTTIRTWSDGSSIPMSC